MLAIHTSYEEAIMKDDDARDIDGARETKRIDKLSLANYNETGSLKEVCQTYNPLNGHYITCVSTYNLPFYITSERCIIQGNKLSIGVSLRRSTYVVMLCCNICMGI